MRRQAFIGAILIILATGGLFFFSELRQKPAAKNSITSRAESRDLPCVPSIVFIKSDKTICVEIADEFTERIHGLADRDTLGDDAGMLFIFDNESTSLSFHMAGMRFPLDMLFLRKVQEVSLPSGSPTSQDLEVVYIAQNLPACYTLSPSTSLGINSVEGPDRQNCASVQPGIPAQYVLEINAGKAKEWGIEMGDALAILR